VTTPSNSNDERILVVAPTGADARNLSSVLKRAGLTVAVCPNVSAVALEIKQGCGGILLTEEALHYSRYHDLSAELDNQPPWSDIPIVLIVTGGSSPAACAEAVRLIGPRSNIAMIERPLRTATLLSTLDAALRARRRQYQVKSLLQERDELLATLEQRVAERTAQLEELNGELEAFSYSVSHDLRAPLRSLETYAKILCEEFTDSLSEEGRHYAERIAKNAEKMDRLTRDVLTLSRLSRGDMPMVTLDLDVVLSDVIDQYPDLAAAHRHIEIRSPLGHVYGHGPSLTQCFSNLLQNALKFSRDGGGPRIVVWSESHDNRMRIWVEDNGVGIDPAHHKRIFGIFERASSANVPGTGIGLAIAKKAVERMRGSIGVNSELGVGSRFWIELLMAPGVPDRSRQDIGISAPATPVTAG
jgi:signal transduction histidine kinase